MLLDMNSGRKDGGHLLWRWGLLVAGWAAWGLAITSTTPASTSRRLFTIYPEIVRMYRSQGIPRGDVVVAAVVIVFVMASMLGAASPALMLLNHQTAMRGLRWVGWFILGGAGAAGYLVVRNGFAPAFVLLGLAHVLVCAAIVPWPGETRPADRGFEVVQAESEKPTDRRDDRSVGESIEG